MTEAADPINPRRTIAHSRHTLRQLGKLAGAYWISREKHRARSLTLMLALLTLAQVGLAIWTNYWNRALFDALDRRSLSALLEQVGTFALIFVLTMLVTAVHLSVKRRLQLAWRRWLTGRLIGNWMNDAHHYRLMHTAGEHDNPDGRIAEDVRIATETAVSLGHTLLFSLLILGSFIDILWRVSGSASVPGTSTTVPGYMVILAFAYAGVGTLLGALLGRPLIRSTNRLQTAEANFRFGLAHSRENSEAIALLHGEAVERRVSHRLFGAVASRWNRQTLAYLWIVSFSTGYGTLLPVFPILIAAPQYISGAMTLGILMQAAQAFQRLTSALSWPIDSLGDIAKCRASADRVLSLYHDLQQLETRAETAGEDRIATARTSSSTITVRGLSIATPDGKTLLRGFDAQIEKGERVLITADATTAAALFKVLAGLWPWGRGTVELPRSAPLEFVPQRPYLPTGTLRDALSYPQPADAFSTREIHEALARANAAWLSERLDHHDIWDRTLPLHVQQRLTIARVFLHHPAWLFVEEASEFQDANGVSALLDAVRDALPSATVVTVSVHAGLEAYHTRQITLTHSADITALPAPATAI